MQKLIILLTFELWKMKISTIFENLSDWRIEHHLASKLVSINFFRKFNSDYQGSIFMKIIYNLQNILIS